MECFTVNLSSTQETHKGTMPKKKKKKDFCLVSGRSEVSNHMGRGFHPGARLITVGFTLGFPLEPARSHWGGGRPLWPEKAKSQLFKHRGTGLSLLGAEEVFCSLPVYHMKRWPL